MLASEAPLHEGLGSKAGKLAAPCCRVRFPPATFGEPGVWQVRDGGISVAPTALGAGSSSHSVSL